MTCIAVISFHYKNKEDGLKFNNYGGLISQRNNKAIMDNSPSSQQKEFRTRWKWGGWVGIEDDIAIGKQIHERFGV